MDFEKSQQAVILLNEIVQWWDKWNSSENPVEMENPPIDDAKRLLAEMGIVPQT